LRQRWTGSEKLTPKPDPAPKTKTPNPTPDPNSFQALTPNPVPDPVLFLSLPSFYTFNICLDFITYKLPSHHSY